MNLSHPTRVRGLKFNPDGWERIRKESHPTRVRGLKWFVRWDKFTSVAVAPHPGAWIEIILYGPVYQPYAVAPHPGAWIEIAHSQASCQCNQSRTPPGCVD